MLVVLGVTGGIAAYKATAIIRLLTAAGHQVKVVPTQNALRFIGATTLEALSHHAVDPDLYTDVESVKHVELGQSADLVIVAPATASFLARMASGVADDLLGNTILATRAPVLVAPAMHTEMWQNPATRANVETLRERGITVLEPAVGRLTGEDVGPGRLPEPEDIVAAALALAGPGDLRGKRILVTLGGTQEPIDPVRYIGNRSSGKQGLAIAREARQRGAEVHVIAANVDFTDAFAKVTRVASAADLEKAVLASIHSSDALVMCAAVADYRVDSISDVKLKRGHLGERLQLSLVANPDILALANATIRRENLRCVSVGFAAETSSGDQLLNYAKGKLESKGCDLIVANDVSGGAVFGAEANSVTILAKDGALATASGGKAQVATAVVDALAKLL